MKLITILKQVLKEYELKKPENIYTPGSGPSSLSIKLKRTQNFSKEEKVLIGDTFEIDDSEGTPMLIVKSKDNKVLASVLYDDGEFVEGRTNFKYVYKPMSASATILFKDLKTGNIDKLKKDAEEYKLSEMDNPDKEKTSKSYKDFIDKRGNVSLVRTMVSSIPGGIEIKGDLRLGREFTTLPRNLKINGNLDVDQSQISKFPNGLEIGGDLDLRYRRNIIDIPKDIVVKGTLFLPQDGFSLAKKYPVETLKKIFPNVNNIEIA
jgi:hypothetical protein